jgi:2-octaprenyl-6-methoxyphenol hydroxylase
MAERLLIAGDGPVASLLALALAERRIDFALCGDGVTAADRPIALSWGSRLLLERYGVFGDLPATPIESIHVSQRGAFGRTLMRAQDEGLPALGYVVSYERLQVAMRKALARPMIEAKVIHYSPTNQGDAVLVTTANRAGECSELKASMLVLAEGTRTPNARAVARDYGQSAVVARVKPERPQPNRAWERFTPEGPLALLPDGDALALVWSTSHGSARVLQGLRDSAFLARLQTTFGDRLGRFLDVGPRSSFPVSLRHERAAAMPGVIAIGNAAQTLHPVAGQGLNLGFRDAWELAQLLGERDAAAHDQSSASLAHRFLSSRAIDRGAGIRFTDALVRVFSNDNPVAALARGATLAALDLAPPARSFLARRMMFGARAW